jgi:membrane dipeptidase
MNHAIPICDLHCDTAMGLAAGKTLDDPGLQVNLPAMREAGIGLQVFACYVPPVLPEGRKFDFASKMLDALEKEIGAHGAEITVCRCTQDILDARSSGRIAAILAVENGDALEGDLKNLERFHARGVRLLTLVHSRSNRWIISCGDKAPSFEGLTRFGEEIVAAMNKLGMIIDVSHAHDRAVEKVLEQSCRPIVASHSCAYTICPVPRNLKDPLIKRIAAGGGLVGVNIYPGFLDAGYTKASEKLGDLFSEISKEEEKAGPDPAKHDAVFRGAAGERFRKAMSAYRVPLDRYLEHLFHMLTIAGDDHVAFGSDFDGVPDLPEGVTGCRGLGLVRARLAEAELPRKSIEKLCWTNFLRIFQAVCG